MGSIIISNTVTEIGNLAFSGCSSLISITLPQSIKSIGYGAFYDCDKLVEAYNLTGLDVGNCFNSSNKIIHISTNEKSILEKIDDYVFMSVDNKYYLIGYTGNDTELSLPESYRGSSYAVYNNFLYNRDSITKIISTGGATSIGEYAFRDCSSLETVVLSEGVTSIGFGAFWGCEAVTSVDLPNSLTYMDKSVFFDCVSLVSIVIPDNVTAIDNYTFSGCTSLKNAVIGEGVTSIGVGAFRNCSKMTDITVGSSVSSISKGAFEGCTGVVNVNITDLTAWCNIPFMYMDGTPLYYKNEIKLYLNGELLTDLVIPDGITSISGLAFYNCAYIRSLVIPSSVTTIGTWAFHGCSSLSSVTISEGVTSISDLAFNECSSLTSIILPSSLKTMKADAFLGCDKLVEVYNLSPLDVTSHFPSAKVINDSTEDASIIEKVDDYIFMTWEGEYYLIGYVGSDTEITLPKSYDGNSYVIFSYAFKGSKVTKVTIPKDVKIGRYAFYHCDTLKEVIMENGVTSIGDGAFYYCSSLTDIVIPESITKINNEMFRNCASLTSITLHDGITSIGNSAFNGCLSLESIVLPSGVTSIGSVAFAACPLKDIVIPDSINYIGDAVFLSCSSLTSVTFENTEGWSCRKTSSSGDKTALDVSDASANASSLTGKYVFYIWSCE